MKKLCLFAVLTAMIGLAACSKKDDDADNDANGFDYAVNNVQDVTVEQGGTVVASWEVKLSKGSQQTVKLDVTGTPSNVTVTPNSTEGIPTYTAAVAFAATSSAATGTYPMTVTSSSASTTSKTYTFNLIVKENCITPLIGTYSTTESCSISGDLAYNCAITTGSTSTTVQLTGFGDYINGNIINATIDCDSKTITIPSQAVTSGITISGSGTFSGNTLVINYTAVTSSNTESCTATLVKQ